MGEDNLIASKLWKTGGIERNPHPLFSVLWAGWYAALLVALALPTQHIYATVVLVLFLPVELTAVFVNTGMRDTLSEIMTWLQRHFAKDRDFMRGWNALLLGAVLLADHIFTRTVVHFSGSELVGSVAFVIVAFWLYDHWMNPDQRG